MSDAGRRLSAALVLWVLLVLIAQNRVPLPVDETRYLAVAWEMWLRGDWLVPHLDGVPYSHKPPLLFWLIELGWWVGGVGRHWPLLVPALCQVGSLALTAWLARLLWPELRGLAAVAVLLLLGSLLWAIFSTAVMFDILLAFWALLGVIGVATAGGGRMRLGWTLLGLAVGGGVLAKGPVILLHVLPVAVLAPLWRTTRGGWLRWYLGLLAGVALGAVIALAWAVPAALSGGPDYAHAIFWGQTAGRMVESFAHQRPWWWYLPLLPLLLFPWLLWPTGWRGLAALRQVRGESAVRFCLAWLLPTFVGFSLISGKQPHYLLPLFPAFALLLARGLVLLPGEPARPWLPALGMAALGVVLMAVSWWAVWHDGPHWLLAINPVWGVLVVGLGLALLLSRSDWHRQIFYLSVASLLLVGIVYLGLLRGAMEPAYDMRPAGRYLAILQAEDVPLAHLNKYHGQFHFAGRLKQPIPAFNTLRQLAVWARQHPDGRVIVYYDHWPLPVAEKPEFSQPFRTDGLAVWPVRQLLTDQALHNHLKD